MSEPFFIGALLYLLGCLSGSAFLNLRTQRNKIIAATHDATLQKKKTENLKEILETQRKIISNSSNMPKALQTMAEGIGELIHAESCIIAMLEGDEFVNYAGSADRTMGLRVKMEGSLSGLCIKMGTVLKCDDTETDPRVDRETCRKTNVRSGVVVPLSHRDLHIGVLLVQSSRVAAFNDDDVAILELMAGFLSATVSTVIMNNTLRLHNLELSATNISLEKMATTDGLTGLYNCRIFHECLSREYDLAVRHKRHLSLIILDVDHFKKFNDSFGHPAGDAILQKIGTILKQLARKTDYVARYGGEEFVLLLPETRADDAMVIANRIQQTIANEKWDHRQVTVSVGVSALEDNVSSSKELLAFADKALYTAKEGGRNQVVKHS